MNSINKTAVKPVRPRGVAIRLGLLIGALGLGQVASAATATGVMTVTATVASSCIVGTSTLAFGNITSAAIQAGNIDAAGTVIVNCTNGSAYQISLDRGVGVGATFASRKMTSGTNLLNYTVYSELARITLWGDGTTDSATVAGIGTGAIQSIAAYGRIFSGQTVPAASYTDTINVSVSY